MRPSYAGAAPAAPGLGVVLPGFEQKLQAPSAYLAEKLAQGARPRTAAFGRGGRPFTAKQQEVQSKYFAYGRRAAGPGGSRVGASRSIDTSSFANEKAAIAAFVAENKAACKVSEGAVQQFLDVVRQGQLNGVDMRAILRVAKLGGMLPGSVGLSAVNTSRAVRNAQNQLAFSESTKSGSSKEGKQAKAERASLLWEEVQYACQNLPALTRAVSDILAHQFGIAVPNPQFMSSLSSGKHNAEVTAFVQANQSCTAKSSEISALLNAIDMYHLRGGDVKAIMTVLGLEGAPVSRSFGRTRVAQLALSDATRGRASNPRTAQQIKHSLLWYILANNCQQLPQILGMIQSLVSKQQQAAAPQARARPASAAARLAAAQQAAAQQQAALMELEEEPIVFHQR